MNRTLAYLHVGILEIMPTVPLRKMNNEDGQVYSVCILQFSCFTKYAVKSQNINKQNVNMAYKTLKDYNFFQ